MTLYVVNRAGNVSSHKENSIYFDKAIKLFDKGKQPILLLGDTDFSNTKYLNDWNNQGHYFVFGYDAKQNLMDKVKDIHKWLPLKKKQQKLKSERTKLPNRKREEEINRKRDYCDLISEEVAEFSYSPTACAKQSYRMIVIKETFRKKIGKTGEFEDEVKYYFYISNLKKKKTASQIVEYARSRCGQENVYAELYSVNAFHIPSKTLESNWAWMIIRSLIINIKILYGLMSGNKKFSERIVTMEVRTFIAQFMRISTKITKVGEEYCLTFLEYRSDFYDFVKTWRKIKHRK